MESARAIARSNSIHVGPAVAAKETGVLRKGVTVLVIDDEVSQRSMMRGILENAGYEVLEGRDYREALVIHANHRGKVDVVLTDIALPGQDGCQMVRTLIEADPELRAVFVSGQAGAELCRFYGLATTDIHFLAKPFSPAELLRRIRTVLTTGGPYLTRGAG